MLGAGDAGAAAEAGRDRKRHGSHGSRSLGWTIQTMLQLTLWSEPINSLSAHASPKRAVLA